MVVLEGLLGPRVREPAVAEVVKIGDQTAELAPVDPNGVQLVLVVLAERTENGNTRQLT